MKKAYLKKMIEAIVHASQDSPYPIVDPEVEHLIQTTPHVALELLDMLIDEYAPKREKRPEPYYICQLLLTEALISIRYGMEKGWAWAQDMALHIQEHMVARVFSVRSDLILRQDLLEALSEAKITMSETLKLANHHRFMAADHPPETEVLDMAVVLNDLAKSCDSPFPIAIAFMQQAEVLPLHAQQAMVFEILHAEASLVRQAAVLMLLGPNPDVRDYLLQVLSHGDVVKLVDSISLMRLIAIRNWLPEKERATLDKVIQKARRAHIECATLPMAKISEILATEFDGAGAQGLFIITQNERRYRIAGILLKENVGVQDPWVTEPITRKEKDDFIERIGDSATAIPVTKEYLQKAIQHFITLNLEKNTPPPLNLLEIAEICGLTIWYPSQIMIEHELESLEADALPLLGREKNAVQACVQGSGEWLDQQACMGSWFEDDAEIASILDKIFAKVKKNPLRYFAEKEAEIIEKVLGPRRNKWRDRLLWMALWAKASQNALTPIWVEFFILANEINQGRALGELPLMRSICRETIASAMSD